MEGSAIILSDAGECNVTARIFSTVLRFMRGPRDLHCQVFGRKNLLKLSRIKPGYYKEIRDNPDIFGL